MSLFLDLSYPSSFRGEDFYYISGSYDVERSIVEHNFLNKDLPKIEDFGLKSRTFNINALVTGTFYLNDRDDLENVLKDGKEGYFVHPTLGQIWCKCSQYTISEDNSQLGNISFSIIFKEVPKSDKVYPAINETDVTTKIAHFYRSAYDYVGNNLKGRLIFKYANSTRSVLQKMDNFSSRLSVLSTNRSSTTPETVKSFNTSISSFNENKGRYVSGNKNIGDAFTETYFAYDMLSTDQSERFTNNVRMIGFGSNDVYFNEKTISTLDLENNDKTINGTINVLALISMFDAAKNLTYSNVNYYNNIVSTINNSFEQVIASDDNIIMNDLYELLLEAKTAINVFLNNVGMSIKEILLISANEKPFTALIYQYYGNLDNYTELFAINKLKNPSLVSGDILIYEPQ